MALRNLHFLGRSSRATEDRLLFFLMATGGSDSDIGHFPVLSQLKRMGDLLVTGPGIFRLVRISGPLFLKGGGRFGQKSGA